MEASSPLCAAGVPGVTLCFLGFQVCTRWRFAWWLLDAELAAEARGGDSACAFGRKRFRRLLWAQQGGVSPCAFGRKRLAFCFILGRKVPPFALGRNALFGVSRRGWRGAALLLVLRQAGSARGGRHAGVGAVIGCLSPCEKARFHIFKSGARCMTLGCGARLRGRRRSGARRRGGRGGGST